MAFAEVSENVIAQEFFNFMSSVGIQPKYNFEPILDGNIHRFACEGDKSTSKSGAYYVHADGLVNFGVMDFRKHSEMQKGRIGNEYLPQYDEIQYNKMIEESRRRAAERAREEKEKAARAHEKMLREYTIYNHDLKKHICRPQNGTYIEHPYLRLKGIDYIPFGAGFRVKRNQSGNDDYCNVGDLLIPLTHVDSCFAAEEKERITNLQKISGRLNQEGKYEKRFYYDIPTTGCYCELIPEQCKEHYHMDGPIFSERVKYIIICEGVATGLSLLKLFDFESPVFCAMSCHNLMTVARAWRAKLNIGNFGAHKNIEIIIAADNDKSGLGIKKANDVVNAGFAVKEIHPPVIGNDWNDYYLKTYGGLN